MATLREAVKTVREAAEALQMASDEAQKPMQRLNLREARSILVSCLQLQQVCRFQDGRLCAGFLKLQPYVGAGTAAGTAEPSMLWWRRLRCCFRGHNAADITGHNAGVTVTPRGHAPLQYLHRNALHVIRIDRWTFLAVLAERERTHFKCCMHCKGHIRCSRLQTAHELVS